MKRHMKKALFGFLFLSLTLLFIENTNPDIKAITKVSATCNYDQTTNTVSGTLDTLKWELPLGTRTLTISGKGSMYDFSSPTYEKPWDEYKSYIENVIIGDEITHVGNNTFSGLQKLKKVTLGRSVTSIGKNAFYRCIGLQEVKTNDDLLTIGDSAFADSSLAKFTFPASLTTLGKYCFKGSCLSVVNLPEKITTIPDYAFANILYLETINLPSGLTSIGNYAFKGRNRVINLVIPSSVTTIGDYAFYYLGDARLEIDKTVKITFPGSLPNTISDTAFNEVTGYAYHQSSWSYVPSDTAYGASKLTWIAIGSALPDDNSNPTTHTHSFGPWTVTKEATAISVGTQARFCSCGEREAAAISKLIPTIKLNAQSITLKRHQSTTKIKVSGLAKGDSIAKWSTSNSKVVKASKKGKITAQDRVGTAKIYVTLKSGKKAAIKVKVQINAVKTSKITGLSKKLTLKKGAKKTLKPVLKPITSTQKITYKSSNKSVATISSKGVIKAKKKGTTTITVKSGKKSFKIKVTVKVK